MRQNSVSYVLWMLTASKYTVSLPVPETNFDFFPDRDNIKLFSLRIPITVLSAEVQDASERVPRKALPPRNPDSINVKVENDQGYICAEERESHNLEISRLPCDRCKNGELLVTIEMKKGNEILSTSSKILFDESRRAEICSLQPEKRKQGEDLVVTSPKQKPEDGCRWVFRDAGGSVGCCYSNRDYYTESGGCDPRMQSSACRKGSESPILAEEENSCTFRINNLKPADSGNYLSQFKYSTPGFKKILFVEAQFPTFAILIICLSSFFLLGILTVIYLYMQRTAIYSLVKENLMKMSSSEKVYTSFNIEP